MTCSGELGNMSLVGLRSQQCRLFLYDAMRVKKLWNSFSITKAYLGQTITTTLVVCGFVTITTTLRTVCGFVSAQVPVLDRLLTFCLVEYVHVRYCTLVILIIATVQVKSNTSVLRLVPCFARADHLFMIFQMRLLEEQKMHDFACVVTWHIYSKSKTSQASLFQSQFDSIVVSTNIGPYAQRGLKGFSEIYGRLKLPISVTHIDRYSFKKLMLKIPVGTYFTLARHAW